MAQDETTKGRVPLTATRGISVFGLSVVGLMAASLVPVMIVALTREIGFSDAEAGTLMTGSLLACALACLLTSKWAAHSGRYVVARAGLMLTATGFGVATFIPSPGRSTLIRPFRTTGAASWATSAPRGPSRGPNSLPPAQPWP
jgi:DHA1 family inner membrane transport protein